MDNGNWGGKFDFKIKQDNFIDIENLLRKLCKKNVDDAVIYSFLNYQGIGI